ncbi:MAG: response regulator [Bacteroidia bacterium]|nr:response regulator [Bacteroidia bacterium]
MGITALLIDDEVHCTETLQWQLEEYCPDVEVVGTCNSPREGLAEILIKKPQLVFLDIEMPFMTGFELLSHFKNPEFGVVFTTAYDDFALDAFRVSAMDYLLKPIRPERLAEAVGKFRQRNIPGLFPGQLEILRQALFDKNQSAPVMALPTRDGMEFVNPSQILYCEADHNYAKVEFSNGGTLLVCKSLGDLEETLKKFNFLRIHHSYLVNTLHLRKYIKGDGGYVILSNGAALSVSRTRKADLIDFFL